MMVSNMIISMVFISLSVTKIQKLFDIRQSFYLLSTSHNGSFVTSTYKARPRASNNCTLYVNLLDTYLNCHNYKVLIMICLTALAH